MNTMTASANCAAGISSAGISSANFAKSCTGKLSGRSGDSGALQGSTFASLLLGRVPSGDAGAGTASSVPRMLSGMTEPVSAVPLSGTDAAASPATDDEASEDSDLEGVLESLLQMLDAMPAEWRECFASWEPVRQWVASAGAELAIATGEPIIAQVRSEAGTGDLGGFKALISRLSAALRQDDGQTPLRRIAMDAKQVVGEFFTTMDDATVRERPQNDNGSAIRPLQRPASDAARSSIASLLSLLNGNVISGSVSQRAPAGQGTQYPHLAAMEAKVSSALRWSVQTGRLETEPVSADGHETPDSPVSISDHAGMTSAAGNGKGPVSEMQHRSDPVLPQLNAAAFPEEMAERLLKLAAGGKTGTWTEAKISLMPEHLGHMEIKLSVRNGELTATFTADSPMAKEMLEAGLSALRTNLQTQGVQVGKLEVLQQTASGSGMFQDGKQRQPAEKDSRQSKQRYVNGIEERTGGLIVLPAEGEIQRIRNDGSSFHATA